jgi:hypothetical protein
MSFRQGMKMIFRTQPERVMANRQTLNCTIQNKAKKNHDQMDVSKTRRERQPMISHTTRKRYRVAKAKTVSQQENTTYLAKKPSGFSDI